MIDEPTTQQIEDFNNWNKQRFTPNPDKLKQAYGPLGSKLNPITVNGLPGAYSYLQRLRTTSSSLVFFQRVACAWIEGLTAPVDQYEYLSLDGKEYGYLWLSLYHNMRTTATPVGFQLLPIDQCDDFMRIMIKSPVTGFSECFESFPEGVVEKLTDMQEQICKSREKAERIVKVYRDSLEHIERPECHLTKKQSASLNALKSVKEYFDISNEKANNYEAAALRTHNFLGFAKQPFQTIWSKFMYDLLTLLPLSLNKENELKMGAQFMFELQSGIKREGDFDLAFVKGFCELGGEKISSYLIYRHLVEQQNQGHQKN